MALDPKDLQGTDLLALSKKAALAYDMKDVLKAINADSILESWGFAGLPVLILVDREGNILAIENSSSRSSLINIEKRIEEAVR